MKPSFFVVATAVIASSFISVLQAQNQPCGFCISDLDARPKSTKIQLTWTNSNNAPYRIMRSTTSATAGFAQIGVTSSTYSTFLDEQVVVSREYWYQVIDANGCPSVPIHTISLGRVTNQLPVITSNPATIATVGTPYSFLPTATDPDGQTMSWFLDIAPVGMTINQTTGRIDWNPPADQAGRQVCVLLRVNDQLKASSQQLFSITIQTQGPTPQCDNFFGPTRYDRTTGAPNDYSTTIIVPPNVPSPYTLHIQNGNPDGTQRVSSATAGIQINDREILQPSDLNQNVAWLEREVDLTPTTTLKVRVASKPGSFLLINICGKESNPPAPVVVITNPAEGLLTNQTPVPVSWTVDGVLQTTQRTENLAEGVNTIIRSATNSGGRGADTVHVTLDTHPPFVRILSPLDGFITNTTPVDVTWAVDGAPQTTLITESLVDGRNTVTRTATDAAGNIGIASVNGTLDTTAPDVRILSPKHNSLTNQPIAQVSWSVDGTEQTTQLTEQLQEGMNIITRTAIDAAGNKGSATIIVTLDTQAPAVAITSPANNLTTNQASQTVSWTVDEVPQTTQLSATLVEGKNTIIRTATDAAGNTGADSINVMLDTQAPAVSITSPINGLLTNQASQTVAWSVDEVPQTTQLTATLVEGKNTIIRTATDAVGNTGADSITMTLDTQAPAVSITSPTNGLLTNQASQTVSWAVDEVPQTTQLSATLVEGKNTIIRTATDAAGNTGADSITVTLDTHAPEVKISSPTEGAIIDRNPIEVQWTIDGVAQTMLLTEDLQFGENVVIRSSTDAAGNVGNDTVKVILRQNRPFVTIDAPVVGAVLTTHTVLFQVSSRIAGISITSIYVDGGDSLSQFLYVGNQYTASLACGDGYHSIRIISHGSGGIYDTVESVFKVQTASRSTEILISGNVYDGKTMAPLKGATVRVLETGNSASVNDTGAFTIGSSGFGLRKLEITHHCYTTAMRTVKADTGINVVLGAIIIIPLDTNSVTVPPNTDTTVALADSAVEMDIPSGALSNTMKLSATVYTHIVQLPDVQPTNDVFLFGVDLKPNGATFPESLTVRVANRNEITAGADIPITYFNEAGGKWENAGTGFVTADAKFIEFKVTHFCVFHGNGHGVVRSDDDDSLNTDQKSPGCGCGNGAVSVCELDKSAIQRQTGDLYLDLSVPGGAAFGNLDVKLNYWSFTAAPRHLISTYQRYVPMTPTYVRWSLTLLGQTTDWYFNGSTEQNRISYMWNGKGPDGEEMESGLYVYGIRYGDFCMPGRYRLALDRPKNFHITYWSPVISNRYFYGYITHINNTNSPYGAGWSIEGVNRIVRLKSRLPQEYPDRSAYRNFFGGGLMARPEAGAATETSSSISIALGTTKGAVTGEHVSLIGSGGSATIYWQQGSSGIYIPSENAGDSLFLYDGVWMRKLSSGTKEYYNSRGNIARRVDRHNHATIYVYDAFGERLNRIIDEVTEQATRFFYDSRGKLYRVIDQYGRETSITIDNEGNLTAIRMPDNKEERIEYNRHHRAIRKILPGGATTEYVWGEWGGITSTRSPDGLVTAFTRKIENSLVNNFPASLNIRPDRYTGLPTHLHINHMPAANEGAYSVSTSDGAYTEYTFNHHGLIDATTNKRKEKTRYFYDDVCGCGITSRIEYPNGLTTQSEHDIHGNLLMTRNAATGATTHSTYITINGADYIATTTNAAGIITRYEYNNAGDLVRIVAPGSDTTAIEYDGNHGLPIAITDSRKRTIRMTYDQAGRVVSRTAPDNATTRYTYDAYGNIQTITGPDGKTTTYVYSITGELLESRNPASQVTHYTYNNAGRLASLTDPAGHATRFEYTPGGSLIRSINHLGIARSYSYKPDGRLASFTNARGQSIEYKYDDMQRLLEKTSASDGALARYGYDQLDNLVYAATPEYFVNRKFDQAGRMTQEEISHSIQAYSTRQHDTIAADDFSKDNTNLVIDKDTVVIDGEHNFLSVRLLNGAVLKHQATDINAVHRLKLVVRDTVLIDATSSIDVTGLGYCGSGRGGNNGPVGYTDGNSPVNGSGPGSGGSHGGKGGEYVYGAGPIPSAQPYDDRFNPALPGGGGGGNPVAGANGGGIVHLYAPFLKIEGAIYARGENAVNPGSGYGGCGAGAGGSVLIKAATVAGGGIIDAAGGNGLGDYNLPRGGGGGRIYVEAQSLINITGSVLGGTYGGLNGTCIMKNGDSLIISPLLLTNNLTMRIEPWDQSSDDRAILVDSAILIVNGSHSFKSITLRHKAVLSHDIASDSTNIGVSLVARDFLTIDSTSSIDANVKGYRGATPFLSAQTAKFVPGSTGLSGGSHGGRGGYHQSGYSMASYDVIIKPTDFGGGGSCLSTLSNSYGGTGGGRIDIKAPLVRINGKISANGGIGYYGGGGAGGSIFINCDTILGSGTLSANGANGSSENGAAGGGGGRIALIKCDYRTFGLGKITVNGGWGGMDGKGGSVYCGFDSSMVSDTGSVIQIELRNANISIYEENKVFEGRSVRFVNSIVSFYGKRSFDTLIVDSNSILTFANSVNLSSMMVEANSRVTFGDTLNCLDMIRVMSGSRIRFENEARLNALVISGRGYVYSDKKLHTSELLLDSGQVLMNDSLFAQRITINQGGLLDRTPSSRFEVKRLIITTDNLQVNEGGRIDVTGLGYPQGYTVNGDTAATAWVNNTGGSHGGSGEGPSCLAYDSYKEPTLPGAGGTLPYGTGSEGGGVIRILTKKLVVDGLICADGRLYNYGSGAGGSIWITSDTLSGLGIIRTLTNQEILGQINVFTQWSYYDIVQKKIVFAFALGAAYLTLVKK
jgi:YD repeat-containing protein